MLVSSPAFDAVVVGAGPAGSVAARELAKRGIHVLLVDKAAFPRYKVCGGCLNRAALEQLQKTGLGDLPASLGARRLEALRLFSRRAAASLPLPGGVSLSRQALDAALIDAAVETGVEFQSKTAARLEPLEHADQRQRCLALHGPDGVVQVQGGVVLAADGLAGRLLQGDVADPIIAESSHMGVGAMAETCPESYESGAIYMACGPAGYVGLVRVERDRLNIAAALDPRFIKRQGGPGAAVVTTLQEANLPVPDSLRDVAWQGTPLLTRRPSTLACHRVFALGDAAGYVEPFTGEGMAWALGAADAIAPIALQATHAWTDDLVHQWRRLHRQLVGSRQRRCRWIARGLRSPLLTAAFIRVLAHAPMLARPMVHAIQ